jgi:hypothetical protein
VRQLRLLDHFSNLVSECFAHNFSLYVGWLKVNGVLAEFVAGISRPAQIGYHETFFICGISWYFGGFRGNYHEMIFAHFGR